MWFIIFGFILTIGDAQISQDPLEVVSEVPHWNRYDDGEHYTNFGFKNSLNPNENTILKEA